MKRALYIVATLVLMACGKKDPAPEAKPVAPAVQPDATPTPTPTPGTPVTPAMANAATGEDATKLFYEIMKGFTAVAAEETSCETRVARVEAALPELRTKVAALAAMVADPAVAKDAAARLGNPTEAERDIYQAHGGMFIEGSRASCNLEQTWNELTAPADAAMMKALPPSNAPTE